MLENHVTYLYLFTNYSVSPKFNGAISHAAKNPCMTTDMKNQNENSAVRMTKNKGCANIQVTAFPLYAILKAVNVTVVDFFSLDIEGYEVKVIMTSFVLFSLRLEKHLIWW